MYKDSPVQKDWKPQAGQNSSWGIVTKDYVSYKPVNPNCMWLLRQEDWQRIYYNYQASILEIGYITTFVTFIEDNYEKLIAELKTPLSKEYWNILWCLFVHKEVYGLNWDWDEDKWVKA